MNQVDTKLRRISLFWSLQLALKQRKIAQALSDSIELDRQVVEESFGLSSSKYSFCMVWSLGFSNTIPSLMYHNNQTFTSDGDIAYTFNFYYTPVFAQKSHFVMAKLSKFAAAISIAV